MDVKLNPISSSTAGIPLSVESSMAQTKQSGLNVKLNTSAIQDTLETSDREGDGRQPVASANSNSANENGGENAGTNLAKREMDDRDAGSKSRSSERALQQGQGSLIDLQG